MKIFSWDTERSYHYWDHITKSESIKLNTDKHTINNPNNITFEDTLAALCRVVSELMRIEENRSK